MKKILLFLAAGIISLSAMGQQRMSNSVFSGMAEQKYQPMPTANRIVDLTGLRSDKTTAVGATSRWYNYLSYLDTFYSGAVSAGFPYLWNDSLAVNIYSGGTYGHNTMVNMGSILDPYFSGFNDAQWFDSTTGTFLSHWPTKTYTVDSVAVLGIYGINPAKTSVVDTIFIGYTNGTGATVSNYSLTPTEGVFKSYFTNTVVLARYGLIPGADSLFFRQMFYDSAHNKLGGVNANQTYFTISNAPSSATNINWYDTLTGVNNHGLMYRVLRLPTPMSVAAQNIVGITLTFKSGDPSFPTTLPGDTVLNNNGVNNYYKYNAFRPYVYYRTTGSTSSTPIFAIYDKFDRNIGTFKNLPNSSNGWTDRYIPLWAWSASGGTPSSLQYLYADVHIMCPTCIVGVEDINQNKSAVSAYPNPAGNELNILFKMPDVSNVSVSLINMVGQTVATQNIGKVSNGKAVFNTADLPAGMYIYTLNSNGVRSSGHIAIAH